MPDDLYNVICVSCGNESQPPVLSRLWKKAKKRAEKGYFDALHITGVECGCVKKLYRPDALYRVCGYNDMCNDFDFPFDSFGEAVKSFIELNNGLNVVFIKGASKSVEERLRIGF